MNTLCSVKVKHKFIESASCSQPNSTFYHTQSGRHKRKHKHTPDTKAVISKGPQNNSLGGKRLECATIPARRRIKIMEKCTERGRLKQAGRVHTEDNAEVNP